MFVLYGFSVLIFKTSDTCPCLEQYQNSLQKFTHTYLVIEVVKVCMHACRHKLRRTLHVSGVLWRGNEAVLYSVCTVRCIKKSLHLENIR